MRFANLFTLAVTVSAFFIFPSWAGPVGIVPGRVLIQPKAGLAEEELQGLLSSHGARQVDEIPALNIRVLEISAAGQGTLTATLAANPGINFAEPDFILKPEAMANDPYYSLQWHLTKTECPSAWDVTTGSSSVVIAVIDSGVEGTHADLRSKLVQGWNFYDGNSDTSDPQGHGTGVAGTVAAAGNNFTGIASVAFGCKLLPIRVTSMDGYAYESLIAKALTWAADSGSRVANISFRVSNSGTIRSAAQYFQNRGGVVVVAAGNEGAFDSSADNPYVLTVSATDQADAVPSWSNTGANVDIAAPGVSILSTAKENSYAYWTGTSSSAPMVAGTAALVLSIRPNLSGAEVAALIKTSADDLGSPGWDTQYGWGRLNVSRAVRMAQEYGAPPATDSTSPTIRITSPRDGAKASFFSTTVYVEASDNIGVTKVELYVDGLLTASSTTAPFTTIWSSRRATPGPHFLQTKAYDAAGNSASSQVVTLFK